MAQAIRRQNGDELHMIADADYSDGDIVQKANLAGVVEGPVLTGDPMNVRVKGGYDVAAASATTFALGAIVEWDATNDLAVASGAGDFVLGVAARAKIAGETVVRVLLNEHLEAAV